MSTSASEPITPYLYAQTGDTPAPFVYTLPASLEAEVTAVSATYDGSGASGPFLPCLAFYSPTGILISRVFPGQAVAVGQVAEVSFFPFVPSANLVRPWGEWSDTETVVPPNLGATLVNWQTGFIAGTDLFSYIFPGTQASPLVAGVYAFTAKVSDSSMMAPIGSWLGGSLNTNAPGMRSIESYFPGGVKLLGIDSATTTLTAVWNLSPGDRVSLGMAQNSGVNVDMTGEISVVKVG